MAQIEDEDPAVAGAQSKSWVFWFCKYLFYRNSTVSTAGNSPAPPSLLRADHAMQKTAMQFPLLWVKIKDKDILRMLSPPQNTFAPRIGNQSLFSSQGLLWLHGSCPSFQLFHVIILFFLFLLGCKITKDNKVWVGILTEPSGLCATDKPVNETPKANCGQKIQKTFLNWRKRRFAERASMG